MAENHELTTLDESTFDRVLCVAAHPDDLEYGTAAAVDKWVKAGKTVTYLLVTRGEAGMDASTPDLTAELRVGEQVAGSSAVGVAQVDFLHYPDGVLVYSLEMRRDIARAIQDQMTYPGEVKVTVLRESRNVEFAR